MRDRTSIGYVAVAVFVAVVVCLYLYVAELERLVGVASAFSEGSLERAGLLGDSAGLINALFSGLAFGGVILTIVWQIKNDNRSKANSQKMQFENTFFNMTQTFEHIIDGLSIERTDVQLSGTTGLLLSNYYDRNQNDGAEANGDKVAEIRGRSVFKYIYQERKLEGKQLRDAIQDSGLTAYEIALSGILDHYYRYLYRILKFIDETDLIGDSQKYRYSSIFRAQLSEFELVLIYYNGLSKSGRDKLKPLLEKYSILKNIRESDLASVKDSDGNETIMFHSSYSTLAFRHVNEFKDCWLQNVLNIAFHTFILSLLLDLCSDGLDNFLFKNVLSMTVLKQHNGTIVLLMLMLICYHLSQTVFVFKQVDVKRCDFPRLYDQFRYLLAHYYDVKNLQIVLPVIFALFYICGSHEWYGYGFLLYVNLIIVSMLVKPVVAFGFACYQMYQLK